MVLFQVILLLYSYLYHLNFEINIKIANGKTKISDLKLYVPENVHRPIRHWLAHKQEIDLQ